MYICIYVCMCIYIYIVESRSGVRRAIASLVPPDTTSARALLAATYNNPF